ncbi:sugar ABC transporter substrate-binding protein [Gulosibacter faecalis]|jgi:simple sugar transport system substrate-binding protein|uniref:Sugar ABC transporter substrate-binding protein n=1 Tax=Gulosibacter faecalis TaxID=272240 RepID=A0ABW5UY15_9MICO|nr:sugar ABC transporter substrate-binding protein [Gulosibacter faecalis]
MSTRNFLQRIRRGAFVAAATAAALVLAACSGPAGVNGELNQNSGGTQQAAGIDTPPLKVALITHAVPGDTFWDVVRKGAETAAAKDNVELLYSSDPDGARQAQLVQQAVDQNVDGIIVTLAKPDAMSSAVESAVDAGIPVITINAGENEYEAMGALAHFGQNETVAGEAAGTQLNELGAKNIICVIQEQGQIALEQRCEGVESTFEGKSEILYVNSADMSSVASNITAKLQTSTDIDYVMTLGAPIAMTAIDSIADAGSSAKLATFDMNAEAIKELQDGNIQFIVDQQPYLQGYEAVDGIWLYATNGNVQGGGAPVYTGPQIVTQENADAVAEYAANGTR